ncbi:MAG: indolepyruvate oxidoreductase subunit beta [Propionibacteriaceae bacterium]|nr:indolepyruvate oxidoreductase subunit beta [Propionibacteriaceae bacterium]
MPELGRDSGCDLQAVDAQKTVTVLLCGVGGQGTILGADLLAHCAMAAGWQVKLSEIHGMAQRGGAVTTVVRFGETVAAMVTDHGYADHIIAFETTEALRNLPYLKVGGGFFVSEETIKPLSVLAGNASMPEEAASTLLAANARLVPAVQLAEQLGNSKCSNVVLLGVLAKELGFTAAVWEEQIALRLPPGLVRVNISAFRAGFNYF